MILSYKTLVSGVLGCPQGAMFEEEMQIKIQIHVITQNIFTTGQNKCHF